MDVQTQSQIALLIIIFIESAIIVLFILSRFTGLSVMPTIKRCLAWLRVYSPLFLSFFLLLAAAYIDGMMQVLTERSAARIQDAPPLPDLGRRLFPHIDNWYGERIQY
jgi:hypothetical protein